MSHYTHFTTEERELSRELKALGYSICQIAARLGRNKSSVSREFKRNSNKDGSYSAHAADDRYKQRRKRCGRKPMLQTDSPVKEYVIEKLSLDWSPDEISHRAKLDKEAFSISYNTIYRAIESGVISKKLRNHLRIKRIKNRKAKANDKRGKIADRVMISDRPEIINNRIEVGHWESDTVLGKRNTGCIATHVERVTGYLIAFRLPNLKDDIFRIKTVDVFKKLPAALKKSFTVDNGNEFRSHSELAAQTGMDVYFCDPYSPWQRGSNENTNGLLRQYFPKGTSFKDFCDDYFERVVDLINNRPRKRLGYRTPAEVFYDSFSKCCT